MLKFYSLNYNRKVAIGLCKRSQNPTLSREQQDERKDAAGEHSGESSPTSSFLQSMISLKELHFSFKFYYPFLILEKRKEAGQGGAHL